MLERTKLSKKSLCCVTLKFQDRNRKWSDLHSSPEIKDSQEKNYKKGDNHLHAVSLQRWNPIVHLTYKNFISCKNDPTLFDTGLNSLNTFLYKICTDF